MHKILLLIIIALPIALAYAQEKQAENPFFLPYDTPYGVPPFDKIKNEHYMPAFLKGIEEQRKEIDAIINNNDEPNFNNTIVSLEWSGSLLENVSYVFYNLYSSNTNDEMQKTAKEVAPLLSKLSDDINLNEKLFLKVKTVYDKADKNKISPEEYRLIEKTYKGFVRGGINLPADKKERFRKINEELSLISLRYSENVLKETNKFKLVIDDKKDLDGLPQRVIDAAAQTAKSMNLEGKWVFTLHKPSLIPFIQYSTKRDLREKIYKAYLNRSNNNDEFDNKSLLSKIAALRVERAHLLGYQDHASFVLEENMAKNSEAVYKLLNQLWDAALPVAKKESDELQKMIDKEGGKFKLESWDWWYYAEKVRKEKYNLDENELRPYFKLENVIQGVFTLANKLYGINFIERNDIPKYHSDVRVFQVNESDGKYIGILYTDYFPRESKRAGAWMDEFRNYELKLGKPVTPVVVNVGNLTKPTSGAPSLLSVDDVNTLFHEFGHALHYLFSKAPYKTLQSVPRDFVELPSQIMENWAMEPEMLKLYATHYKTGVVIPDSLVKKIVSSSHFNQGFETVEYLAASFLDMDWHTLKEAKELDAEKFENESMKKIGLIPEIAPRYRSPYFQHAFSGGYDAGYYSYIWAEVLDADAFQSFKEKGLFNKELANSFRKNLLERGCIDDAMAMFVKFKGREPKIDGLLEKRGLK
jgi:peptidyl-dipeptidase Dcp